MIPDLKKLFWISLIITIPLLILSPTIQELVGLGESLRFTGDLYILFILSSIVYFYGGYPFFKGFYNQIKSRIAGMDTLISVAIPIAAGVLFIYGILLTLAVGAILMSLSTIIMAFNSRFLRIEK